MNTFKQLILTICLAAFASIANAQTTYVWTGEVSTSYTDAANWSPSRINPLNSDKLVFNNGENNDVTEVVTETIGALKVENDTKASLSASVVHKILSVSKNMLVSEGSTLTFKNQNGVKVDVEIANNAMVEIGGQLTLEKGVCDFNNATVILHSHQQPLAGIEGQFSLGVGSTLQFGKEGVSSTVQIILPDNIFVGNPAITNLIVNSNEGVKLGNQSLTIIGNSSFILGDVETNNQGYLKFAAQATLPTETLQSKIIGFAEMLPRTVGYDSISFLGYKIAPGSDDLGNVSILRSTGSANFSENAESIAVTWDVIVDNQPEQGRYVSMQWFKDFDNGINVNNPLQMYRYTNGTEWEIVGGATYLAANENGLRISASILTDHFSEWTIGDGLNNALPVSLVSFTGKSSDSGIVLNWTTASELNNDRFVVERMIDGDFKQIASIRGSGTTSALSQYSFADISPNAGTNYYKLTQVDFDGKRTSFETIAVEHKMNTKFEIYPNPTTGDQLNINLAGEVQDNAMVKIYNSNGTLLLDKAFAGNMNMNVLEGQNLTKGLYYLEFVNGAKSEKRRVVIR